MTKCAECGSPRHLVALPHAVLCRPCIDNDAPYWFMRTCCEQWFNVNPGHVEGEYPYRTWVRGWVAQYELARADLRRD